MPSKINVLVFPCGSENASEIYESLKYSLHINLWGASSVEDFGRLNYQNYISNVPFINECGFDDFFSRIIKKNKIDVVFSTHDSVSAYLSKNFKKEFFLINGGVQASDTARSKIKTYNLFKNYHWCPIVYSLKSSIKKWPLIVKPDAGQGAQDVFKVCNEEELQYALSKIAEPVIVEFLPGQEITVDCFTDRNRKIKYVGPRTRERIRAGITMQSSYIACSAEITEIANTINSTIELRGPWFFQLKKSKDGDWKLLEISCRIAGTMVAQRAKGVNLPLMAIHDFMGRDVQPLVNPYITSIERNIRTRAVMDYEYENIYIDLDDTLIVNDRVCTDVISFIYQSRNIGKKVNLISRHEFVISETLKKHSISECLFDEIIHVTGSLPKSQFMHKKSIFIDNYFLERYQVFMDLGIPCFDTESVKFFLN